MKRERNLDSLKRVVLQVASAIVCLLALAARVTAQNHDLELARQFVRNDQPDSALNIYEAFYELQPDLVYSEYVNALELAKKYKEAEKLIKDRLVATPADMMLVVDLGKLYHTEGKDKQATEKFDELIQRLNGDDIVTQQVVRAFVAAGMYDKAAAALERVGQIINNPYVYSLQLSDMYAKAGKIDKAIELLLTGMPVMNLNIESVKSLMLAMVGDSADKIRMAQKAVVAKMNEHPENGAYADLMTWIYTLKNDWDGALLQMEAIDELNHEQGKRLIALARSATAAHQYEVAERAYNDIIAMGNNVPLYPTALSEKLANRFARIQNEPLFTPDEVRNLEWGYDTLFQQIPMLYGTLAVMDYAALCADYAGDADKAILILQQAITRPEFKRSTVGQIKLQMGDYFLLEGKIWDASLTYIQVDKEFKQDPMGEDARFRNAKLAYYRGDFDMAQHELTMLKSATSELIANDALYLSVLITENTQDSNFYPLERFAHADLLLQQNKDTLAESLLDSLSKAFPKHSLDDDILMLRATISEKRHDFNKALACLQTIYTQFGTDVLGDDAVFKIAELYQNNLNNKDSAKHYYEQLIIEYPGSTYVQTARNRLANMSGTNP